MLLSGFSDSLDRTIVSKKIEIFAHCLRPTALSDTDALYIKGMDYAVKA